MDDATQKLVDEGWDKAWGFRRETRSWAEESAARTWFDHGVRIALEAAQRPPVSPVLDAINDAREAVARGERPSIIIDTDDFPAPERPPVSPEQRETMIFTLVELVPTSTGQGISYAAAAEYVDALIARFSLPVLDVEKVARFTAEALARDREGFGSCDFPRDFATALVAAVENGELA